MSLAKAETIPLTASAHRSSFFRQSGWMVLATVASGQLAWSDETVPSLEGPSGEPVAAHAGPRMAAATNAIAILRTSKAPKGKRNGRAAPHR